MPFYEYECSACKYYIEVLQKISDPPLVKCPSCGKEALQRLLSAPVFRLKGSGWYETDFKSDKEQKRNIASDAEPASSDKKDDDDGKTKARARKKIVSAAVEAGATAKPAKKPVKKLAKKAAKKPASKPAAKKAPMKAKSAGKKKVVAKAAKKAAKKAGKRKAAKKK